MGKKEKVFGVIKKLANRWFIDAFSGMAMGLFCTLIAGTILGTIGGWVNQINGGILQDTGYSTYQSLLKC